MHLSHFRTDFRVNDRYDTSKHECLPLLSFFSKLKFIFGNRLIYSKSHERTILYIDMCNIDP